MKRICILGNSHAACWAQAWPKLSAQYLNQVDITFFLLGGSGMNQLVRIGDHLSVPIARLRKRLQLTSNQQSDIRVKDFDAFVIVSLRYGFNKLSNLFSSYATIDCGHNREHITYISQSCMDDAIDGILESSIALKLRRLIGEIDDRPVILVPSPCVSEDGLLGKHRELLPLVETGGVGDLYRKFTTRSDKLAAKHGFMVVYQDPTTMIHGGYTKKQFSLGGITASLRVLANPDLGHMNEEFGRIAMDDAIAKVLQL